MLKRFIIILMSLAYSLTMAHSLVPHHHHEEKAHPHSDHLDNHSHKHHHDHKHDHEDDTLLSHFFGDVLHHPSAKIVIHSHPTENISKYKTIVGYSIVPVNQVLLPDLQPPDPVDPERSDNYIFSLFSIPQLRAPPAV